MPEIQHGSLALPGHWRIVWFGKLEHIPSPYSPPRIKTYVWHLPRWPDLLKGKHAVRYLNVGEIPLLHLNAVLKDGVVVPLLRGNPWTRLRKLSLDLARDNLRVFKRFDRDERRDPIVPVITDYLESDPDANALFVGVGHAGDPYAYLMPCVEVFRFFYALSSALTKAVLTGAFLDPDRHIWDVNKSWAEPKQRLAFLQLRKHMLDADARHLAIYAFVEDAVRRAQDIFLYAAGHDSSEGGRIIRALPPFDGRMAFKAEVIDLEHAGRTRTLITRLVSCDWRLPFDRIDYLRDNDGRSSHDPDDDRPTSGWSRPRKQTGNPPPNRLSLVEGPGSRDESPWELEVEDINSRFPELSKIHANKLEPEESKTKSGAGKVLPPRPPPTQVTVGEVRTSAALIPEALISGLRQVALPEEAIDDRADPSVADTAYLQTAELLLEIQRQHLAEVEFVRATPRVAYWNTVLLNVCPNDLGRDATAWLYVDSERTRPRLVLIASLQWEGKLRYLIDFQRKRPKECSMLVLWSVDGAELPVGYLGQALLACQKAKQVSLVGLNHLPIAWGRVRHTVSIKDIDGPVRLLQRVFAVG